MRIIIYSITFVIQLRVPNLPNASQTTAKLPATSSVFVSKLASKNDQQAWQFSDTVM